MNVVKNLPTFWYYLFIIEATSVLEYNHLLQYFRKIGGVNRIAVT